MKNIILLSLICMGTFNSFAQTKQESIAELIQLTAQSELINSAFNSIPFPRNPAATPVEQERFAEIMKAQAQTLRTLMQKFLNEDMAQIYDRHYTQAEIKDFIAFYKTPSGKKLLSEAPAMQKDIGAIMATKYMPLMMEELKKHAEELKLKK